MENKKIGYIWDKTTREYVGEEIVYLEKATNTYPHADNVTFVKPPTLEPNTQVVWEGDWVVVDDYRGYPIYDVNGSIIGEVTELGVKPNIITPPPHFEDSTHKIPHWKGNQWGYVIEDGYIETNGVVRTMTIDDKYEMGIITKEEYNTDMDKLRESEYREHTDKIGLMVLRGEKTMEEWLSAMDKIRAKYPHKE